MSSLIAVSVNLKSSKEIIFTVLDSGSTWNQANKSGYFKVWEPIFKTNFFKDFICLFLERGEGKERGRETSSCGCLSSAPYWRPGLQPRHLPSSGKAELGGCLTGELGVARGGSMWAPPSPLPVTCLTNPFSVVHTQLHMHTYLSFDISS